MKGYWGKILFIDLDDGRIREFVPKAELYRKYLGASGIGARILYDMTGPDTDPLGPDNPIIWMTGPFTGTKVPTSGRHQITSLSPLTGIFGESDAGGRFGTALKRAGYDGLIVRGISQSPTVIVIKDGAAALESADDLWGRDTFFVDSYMKQKHGPSCEVSCIGAAGERLVPISCVGHDGENARMSGRCGFGAVMGSKKLKAVVVTGEKETEISDPTRFMTQQKKMIPQLVGRMKGLNLLGTAGGTAAAEKMGDLPVQNWRRGNWPDAEKITGQVMADTILKKSYYCASCPIGCGRDVEVSEGRWAGVKGAGPEYETLGLMGGSCLVSDLEAITYAADLCNRHGADTIETGAAIAMAMECYENGLLSAEDLDGIEAEWGSAEALAALTAKICTGEGVGKLLGLGVAGMAKRIPGSEEFAVHVKGLTLPAHDPRCFSTMAVGYATSNRGACHLTSSAYFFEKTAVMPEFGYDKPRPRYTVGGEGRINFHAQNLMGVMDSLKMCKFTVYGGVGMTDICEWYAAVTGREVSVDEMAETGERIFNLKRLYNQRLGLNRKDDILPDRILFTPRNDEGTGDYTPDLEPMLDEYYEVRGWNRDGTVKKETLERLGLNESFFSFDPPKREDN